MPQKMRKIIFEETTDTIADADEIPIMSAEASSQTIYMNGSYSFTTIDKTTDDMHFIEVLNKYPQPKKERVAKTVVNNNNLELYNSDDELISSQIIDEINFKLMLDSLKAYLEEQSMVMVFSKNNLITQRRYK
ncbi:MAG: hypothetical protein PHH37_13930 [Paludibacter sp.]|nr:hypothetical protein [Paludibacter sp.]